MLLLNQDIKLFQLGILKQLLFPVFFAFFLGLHMRLPNLESPGKVRLRKPKLP